MSSFNVGEMSEIFSESAGFCTFLQFFVGEIGLCVK